MRSTALALGLLLGLPAQAATHTVTIEAMKFEPATLTVKRGDRVVWINKDVVPHTATAARRFDSKNIAAGQRWTWKAGKPGRHEYLCTYHPGMKGVIEVK